MLQWRGSGVAGPILSGIAILAVSVYGGYFGAGLSVIVLSALGLTMEDTLTRLNALKQAVAFSVNVAAAIFFIFSGRVVWTVAQAVAVRDVAALPLTSTMRAAPSSSRCERRCGPSVTATG